MDEADIFSTKRREATEDLFQKVNPKFLETKALCWRAWLIRVLYLVD